jgi:hypothetical protein
MDKPRRVMQLVVTTEDKPGMLAEVTESLAKENINIEAINAYPLQGKAVFYLIVRNSEAAKKALAAKGWQVKEEEVVVLDLENQPGSLYKVAAKFKAMNVNLLYCYGTTTAAQAVSHFVFRAADNDLAVNALNG